MYYIVDVLSLVLIKLTIYREVFKIFIFIYSEVEIVL